MRSDEKCGGKWWNVFIEKREGGDKGDQFCNVFTGNGNHVVSVFLLFHWNDEADSRFFHRKGRYLRLPVFVCCRTVYSGKEKYDFHNSANRVTSFCDAFAYIVVVSVHILRRELFYHGLGQQYLSQICGRIF